MKDRSRLALFAAVLIGLVVSSAPAQQEYEFEGGKWAAKAPPAKGTAEGELALIRQYADRGKNRAVISAAKGFLKRYGDDPGREEAMLLAGEAEMARGKYFQAFEWFEKQLAEFPAGRYSDRALGREVAVAEAFLAGKKRIVLGIFRLPARDDGLEILSKVAEHVPGTAIAEKALIRIADDRYAHDEYADATEAYDRYLTAFPNGKMSAEAMLQAANATYLLFNGIAHDDTPLIEADQRYRAFMQRHPISAKDAGVDVTLEEIRQTRGAKALSEGRFYERVHRPSAAVFSYKYAIENFPQTAAAEEAAVLLSRLGGQPVQPPQPPEAATAAPSEAEVKPAPMPAETDQTIELEKLLPATNEAPKADTPGSPPEGDEK